MPDDEGLALYAAAVNVDAGPLLEIGGYCGKSAVYLGAAAAERGHILFSVDHHHGSEENQPGWEHHDPELVDPATGRIDTLPFFRRTIADAGLEGVVVAVVGESTAVARAWDTPLGLLFIDGGHAEAVVNADYDSWIRHLRPGGILAIHDVFADPAEGGQAPYHVYLRALGDGYTDVGGQGSLRLLRRASSLDQQGSPHVRVAAAPRRKRQGRADQSLLGEGAVTAGYVAPKSAAVGPPASASAARTTAADVQVGCSSGQ